MGVTNSDPNLQPEDDDDDPNLKPDDVTDPGASDAGLDASTLGLLHPGLDSEQHMHCSLSGSLGTMHVGQLHLSLLGKEIGLETGVGGGNVADDVFCEEVDEGLDA